MQGRTRKDGKRLDRGFVLVTMAATSVVLLGALGLAVDIGRMYIAKNEAQSFADAAALAAALKLDGTSTGVTNAQTAATSLPDKWNFVTAAFSGTTVQVAQGTGGPWTSASSPPSPATNYTYVKVTANVAVSLYFLPVVTTFVGGSTPSSSTVGATATAAQIAPTTWNEGAFPFSPMAFDGPTGGNNATAPWGFVVGTQYTMRYGVPSGSCAGDAGDSYHTTNGSARGFWGDNSASVIGQQVKGDLQEESLTVGQVLPGVGGAKTSVAADLVDVGGRIDQDTDTTDDDYATYVANGGNGRRVVIMPIQSEVNGTVLGFGTFFLLDDGAYGHTGGSNWCAIYLGISNVQDGGPGASSTPGAYVVKLVQ
jgi:Flp pilus assembly protein TadG